MEEDIQKYEKLIEDEDREDRKEREEHKMQQTYQTKMFKLITPSPFYREYLITLDYDEIVSYCESSRELYAVCKNSDFWALKAYNEFDDIKRTYNTIQNFKPIFNDTFLSPHLRYLQLLVYHGGVGKQAFLFLSEDEYVKRMIQFNKGNFIAHQNKEYIRFLMLINYINTDDVEKVKTFNMSPEDFYTNYKLYIEPTNLITRPLELDEYLVKETPQIYIKSLQMVKLIKEKYPNYDLQSPEILKYGDYDAISYVFRFGINKSHYNEFMISKYIINTFERGDIEIFDFMYPKFRRYKKLIDKYNPYIYKTADITFINHVKNTLNITVRNVDALRFSYMSKDLPFVISQLSLMPTEVIDLSFFGIALSNFDIIKYMLKNYFIFVDNITVARIIRFIAIRHDGDLILPFLYGIVDKSFFASYYLDLDKWDIRDVVYLVDFYVKHNIQLNYKFNDFFIKSLKTLDKIIIDSFFKYVNPMEINTDMIRSEISKIKYIPLKDYISTLFREKNIII